MTTTSSNPSITIPAITTTTLISNPRESHQINIATCAATSWLIGAVFVALRFYTRGRLLLLLQPGGGVTVLGTEDWFILIALPLLRRHLGAGMIEQAHYVPRQARARSTSTPSLAIPMARARGLVHDTCGYMLAAALHH